MLFLPFKVKAFVYADVLKREAFFSVKIGLITVYRARIEDCGGWLGLVRRGKIKSLKSKKKKGKKSDLPKIFGLVKRLEFRRVKIAVLFGGNGAASTALVCSVLDGVLRRLGRLECVNGCVATVFPDFSKSGCKLALSFELKNSVIGFFARLGDASVEYNPPEPSPVKLQGE